MSDKLDLNFCVLDDDPGRVFSVKAEKVNALKEAIKDKKKDAFDAIDADLLDLWKVSIPAIKEEITRLKLNEQPLSPTAKLSTIFSDEPEDGHLHIVVRVPPVGELVFFLHE